MNNNFNTASVMSFKQHFFHLSTAAAVLFNLTFPSQMVWSAPPNSADVQSFIPAKWKILEKVQGDLNADGLTDLALIIESTDPKNIVANENLGSNQLNTNPRQLLVLLKKSKGYQLASSNSSLPTEGDVESPCLEDPMGEGETLSIQKGLLKISFHYWLSCGSWYVTNTSYTFRYQNQKFKLIGFDSDDFHRASGDITERSINFLTGKVKKTSGANEFAESTLPEKVEWSKLKNKYSINLEQIKFNEHIEFE